MKRKKHVGEGMSCPESKLHSICAAWGGNRVSERSCGDDLEVLKLINFQSGSILLFKL